MAPRVLAASCLLAATLLAAAASAGQTAPAGTRPGRRVAASPAAVLARLEAVLLAIDDGREDTAAKVDVLAAALMLAAVPPADPARIETLARELVAALAPAFVDDEGAERLAQDLFAALSVRRLDPREAGLLVDDLTGLLRQAGVAPVQAERVLRSLADLRGLLVVEREAPPSSARGDLRLSRP
jgi:hypothetical protein